MDPAKPYFDIVSHENRLQKTDAEFVDVMHTNSGSLLQGGLSLPEPVGQVDFYANGGLLQPGCKNLCFNSLSCFSEVACSHMRAPTFYIESIGNPDSFMSTECDSFENLNTCKKNVKAPMGEGLQASMIENAKSKLFYLETNAESPFSKS